MAMKFRPRLALGRSARGVLILSFLALAVLYVGPLRTKILSSPSPLQRETVRERIREKLEEKKGEGRANRAATAPSETRQIAGLSVAIWKPNGRGLRSPLIVFSHGFHGC